MTKGTGFVATSLLMGLAIVGPAASADPQPAAQPKPAPATATVQSFKGQLVAIEGEQYIVKDAAGKEVRLHVNQETVLQSGLRVGDKIDAEVSANGHAVTLLRALP